MSEKFGEKCDFDVEDALVKLEKLEIVTKVSTHFNLHLLDEIQIFSLEHCSAMDYSSYCCLGSD